MKAENKKFRTISLCTYISDYKDCVSNDIRSRNFLLLLVYAEVSRCS